ncbi:Transmembrane protein 87A [Mactra antiquata]
MSENKIVTFSFLIFVFLHCVTAFSKQGIWENVPITQEKNYAMFTKSMYENTVISLKIDCNSEKGELVQVTWLLRYSPCAQEFAGIEGSKSELQAVDYMFKDGPHALLVPEFQYDTLEYINGSAVELCSGNHITLPSKLKDKPFKESLVTTSKTKDSTEKGNTDTASDSEKKKDEKKSAERRKRDDSAAPPVPAKPAKTGNGKPAEPAKITDAPTFSTNYTYMTTDFIYPDQGVPQSEKVDTPNLVKVWRSGYYAFIVKVEGKNGGNFDAKVTVTMKGKIGYISAVDWPLLIFYGVMGLVYIIYGLVWLVLLACNWRDLMRLQYWIGGVIVLGMLEKAVFYADYQSIANNGQSVTEGTVIFAEIVSSLKRALARMLVIIVSVGFGIVRPRLGQTFHKVLFVGGLYFILATVEGSMRTLKPKGDQSTDLMLAAVPLAVVDASICWWIFSSLVQTTRQLRLRRNVVKLSLYRHFTNTLIFAVLASLIFMVWSIIQIKMKTCLRDWQEIWIDEAYWHLLFSIILAIIMILWRPSSNNQRYAFSPLIDAADDEDDEDETVLNDAFDGMKNRVKQVNGSPKQKQTSIEDDLKWVEENIPSTLSDKAQTLIESDEEVMTAKYEMSKMQ